MADPMGYVYVVLAGLSLVHLWWQWDGVPRSQRRGRVVFGFTILYAGLLYVTGGIRPELDIAVLGGLTVLMVYYAVQAWRRGESWWHENGYV